MVSFLLCNSVDLKVESVKVLPKNGFFEQKETGLFLMAVRPDCCKHLAFYNIFYRGNPFVQ